MNRVQDPNAAYADALAALGGARHAEAVARIASLASDAVLRGGTDWAASALARALAKSPREPLLLARYAGVAKLAGDVDGALRAALVALESLPGDTVAATIAVELLVERLQVSRAIALGEACIAASPDAHAVRRALSQAHLFQGRAREAYAHALAAIEAAPTNTAAIGAVCLASLYDDTLAPGDVTAMHRRVGQRLPPIDSRAWSSPSARDGDRAHDRSTATATATATPRATRIGFLSADFGEHPVGLFMTPILEALADGRADVRLYSLARRDDRVAARLRGTRAQWDDVAALGDAALLDHLRNADLDVLVDLAGHTHGGRPRVVASRAAPFQLAYLGYPGPNAIPNIDGLVACGHTIPPGHEAAYGLPILRLPSYLARPLHDVAPPVAQRASDAPFVFGSFNHLAKLSDATVALWSDVLRAVPHAKLALCALALADRETRALTVQRFARHGIDPARLILLPPRQPLAAFLRYYDGVDVALDPLPFNGGTTTMQAALQGVPTITQPGSLLASRMGAAIAHALDLDGVLVARDAADYIAKARALASDRDRLASLRMTLRQRVERARALSAASAADALLEACRDALRGTSRDASRD